MAFGVSPGGALRCSYRGIERDIAPQVSQEFGKAERLHCGETGIETASCEGRSFGQSAGLDHLKEPRIARRVKPLSRWREKDCPEPICVLRFCLVLPSPDGYPGRPHYLEGADEPLFVSWEQSLCSCRIEPSQPLAKLDAAQRPMNLVRLLLDLRGDLRNRRQSLLNRPQVEPSAADEDGQPAGHCRLGDLVEREGPPSRRRPALARIEETVEAVRCLRLRRLVGPRRQYPKIPVDLQAVGVDDRAAA